MNRKALSAGFVLIIACSAPAGRAKLSENDLSHYKSMLLSRVIEENPGRETDIRTCLGGMVMEGNMGIRLLDKFGIFMSKMGKKDIEVQKVRFYRNDAIFALFFVMKDGKDEQLYTLFLEYEYGKKARCVLKDIYFSIVFEERMNDIKSFFEAR